MAIAVITSFLQQADSNGVPLNAGTIDVYAAGTTTPLSLWSASDLTGAAANPITLDASGRHAITYIATASYKILVKNSAGTPIYTRDNIDPGVAIGSGALPVANGGTGASTAGGARTNLGAAAESTVTSLSGDVLTLQGYHAGTGAMPLAAGTTAQRPGSPTEYNLRGNTSLGSPEIYIGGAWNSISLAAPISGGFKGLVIQNNSGTPNSQIDLDADAVTVETTSGVAFRLSSIDLTINCAVTGVNGIDAGGLANSTWYYIWVIYNPTTGMTAGLISASATSPTMPSGYTAKARFGANITNGSAQFHRVRQVGRRAQYVVSASITTAYPPIGAVVASAILVARSVSGVVPPTASILHFFGGGGSNTTSVVSPNGVTSASSASTNPSPFVAQNSNTATLWGSIMLESTDIYAANNSGNMQLFAIGWEDNI
jgi:hypothetical protein